MLQGDKWRKQQVVIFTYLKYRLLDVPINVVHWQFFYSEFLTKEVQMRIKLLTILILTAFLFCACQDAIRVTVINNTQDNLEIN